MVNKNCGITNSRSNIYEVDFIYRYKFVKCTKLYKAYVIHTSIVY